MATGPVRNPLAGFAIASLASFVLSAVAGVLSMSIPFTEFRLFALGFGLFTIGALSSRKVFLGSLGFVGAYLGGFLGFYLSELFVWPNPWQELLALAVGLAAGVGGFVSGKIGVIRLERMGRFAPTQRRCHNCGERVGMSARKCWSCKASLPA
jgi:hypothetical protein